MKKDVMELTISMQVALKVVTELLAYSRLRTDIEDWPSKYPVLSVINGLSFSVPDMGLPNIFRKIKIGKFIDTRLGQTRTIYFGNGSNSYGARMWVVLTRQPDSYGWLKDWQVKNLIVRDDVREKTHWFTGGDVERDVESLWAEFYLATH